MPSSFFSGKCIAGLIAGILLTIPAIQALAESAYVIKGSKAASLASCVAETDDIRRNHMDYMKHGRDDTVIHGDRTGKFSISGCIDCHSAANPAGEYVPVDSEGQFCQSCHAYVAVSPACFQCHRTTPEKGGAKLGSIDHGQWHDRHLAASTAMHGRVALDSDSNQPTVTQRD